MKTLVPLTEAQWVLDQAFRRTRTALDTAAELYGDVYMVAFEDGTYRHAFGRTAGPETTMLGIVADITVRAVPQDDPLGLGSDDGGES